MGGAPWGTPLFYSDGNIYGTTFSGGSAAANYAGTVFAYYPTIYNGVENTIYAFAGQPDATAPMSGLTADPYGNFFGTSSQGGFLMKGTMYEVASGIESVVINFNGTDGANPEGGLISDIFGNFYGTTTAGGANASGTVFGFSAFGTFKTLYNFGNYSGDGIAPASNLLFYRQALYGTTPLGGTRGWGTVYEVVIKGGVESVLYSFEGKHDGGTPVGGLVSDGKGNLYGTASVGGSTRGNGGHGVIFKLNIKSGKLTTVHIFTGTDGSQPTATMITDGQGNFFGTTFSGGANGYGTVFELTSAGTLQTLYNFTSGTDGAYPYAGLTMDTSGNLYGAATRGGQSGWGTLFEITP